MSKMVDVFGLKRWYQRLLAENFYKFLVSLGLLACAPLIASVVFDYIVIDGDGRFKASILLGFVLLLLFLLLSFISIAIWAAINSKATGQRRMVLIISAYLMIWLAFGNLYYFLAIRKILWRPILPVSKGWSRNGTVTCTLPTCRKVRC